MAAFLLRRCLYTLLVLMLVSAAARALLDAMPGDPLDSLRRSSPRPLSAADLERLKRHYGIGDPFLVRYLKWLREVAQGDLGYSLTYRVPVEELLWPALARTLRLMGLAFVLALVLSVPLGVRAAVAPCSVDDRFIRLLCYLGMSIPTFWLCLVAVQLASVHWRWLPPDGQIGPDTEAGSAAISYLVLPVLCVAVPLTAEWTRYVRAGLREVLGADYLRAARARGLGEARILWLHALPNALAPFLTVLGLSLPYLVGGELAVEMVFGWPGLGLLEYNAVREADANVAMAALLLIAGVTLLGSLLADLLHAAIDPRVRQGLVP